MASSLTASLRHRCVIVAVLLVAGFLGLVAGYAPEVSVSCRTMLDLRTTQYEAGVLVSALPERIPVYANEEEKCDINLSIGTGSVLMIYFDWLDFYAADMSKCDSTNIQLYDGSIGVYVSGLNRQICGREEQMPSGVYFIEKYHLIIRVSALGVIHGSGFRIHFTLSRRAFPCSSNEFSCETFGAKRCIASHLVCDDWNDCGDWVDEQKDCNNITGGGIAAIVIAAVGLLALIVGLVIFCKCRQDRQLLTYSEKDPAIMSETSAASPVSGGLMAPYSISTEQMEKEYTPRYSNARSSRRSNKDFKADYEEERPPPYTEKVPPGVNDSRSDINDDDSRRRRNRMDNDEEVFDEDERRSRRGRRSRTSSVDRDEKQRNGDDRIPRDRDEAYPTKRGPDDSRDSIRAREEPKDERYPRRGPDDRDRNDRDWNYPPPPRDDRDRDYPPPPRDDYRRSRRDDDRDNDSKHSRDSERDRRRDERSRDRDPRRSRRGEPDDLNSMDEEVPVDQLHPLREIEKSRRSLHSDSDLDYRSDKENPRRSEKRDQRDDRGRRDDRDRQPYPPRDKNDRGHPSRGRSDDDDDDDEYRAPPPGRGDRPTSRHERPPAGREDREDTPPKSRPFRSGSPPPPPPIEDEEDENDDEGQHRRRRRRSRSREDRQRSRYGDAARNGGDRSRESVSGLKEEAV